MSYRIIIGAMIWLIISLGYLLIYRGSPLSIDELHMFDSVESLTSHGTLNRTIQFHRTDEAISYNPPLLKPIYEPLQTIALVPLFLLGRAINSIGTFQTILMFNIIVTTLTALSIYCIGLLDGYSVKSALITTIIFSFLTISVQYTRFLFREPLMGLFTLWAFFIPYYISQHNKIDYRYIIVWLLACAGMILTKQIGIILIPSILLIFVSNRLSIRQLIAIIGLISLLVLLFLLILWVIQPDFGDDRYNIRRWMTPSQWGWQYMWESFIGYQISPSRSFWLYSPPLLLSIFGMWRFVKEKHYSIVISVLSALLIMSTLYGALRLGTYWDGGWTWGPRYLLPLVPVFSLFLLPVFERFSQFSQVSRLFISAVLLLSIYIQLLGLNQPFNNFYLDIEAQSPSITLQSWSADNWQLNSSQMMYHINHFNPLEYDVVWQVVETPFLLIGFILIIGSISIGIGKYLSTTPINRITGVTFISLCIVIPITVATFILNTIQQDERYILGRTDILQVVQTLNQYESTNDIIFIEGNDYATMLIFMNWYSGSNLYITLPDNEAINSEVFQWAELNTQHIWFISENRYAPYDPNLYNIGLDMAESFFLINEFNFSNHANLRQFITMPEDVTSTTLPSIAITEFVSIDFVKFMQGNQYYAGDMVPIIVSWQPTAQIPYNYHVSLQLITEEGQLISQYDSLPQGNQSLTSLWDIGQIYEDNYALIIPEDISPQSLSADLIMYYFATNDELEIISSVFLTSIEIIPE